METHLWTYSKGKICMVLTVGWSFCVWFLKLWVENRTFAMVKRWKPDLFLYWWSDDRICVHGISKYIDWAERKNKILANTAQRGNSKPPPQQNKMKGADVLFLKRWEQLELWPQLLKKNVLYSSLHLRDHYYMLRSLVVFNRKGLVSPRTSWTLLHQKRQLYQTRDTLRRALCENVYCRVRNPQENKSFPMVSSMDWQRYMSSLTNIGLRWTQAL